MARDPPMLLDASPNLRDLTLTPSTIKHAKPVIIHPQLRDLLLPLERGRVLYPRGGAIEELSWSPTPEEEEEEMDVDEGVVEPDQAHQAQARTLARLNFTPNCLVANKTIIAAGGQHGELYITNSPLPLAAGKQQSKALRPFTINISLQSRSINNSMILLPTYPGDWAAEAERRRIGRKWGDSHLATSTRDAQPEAEEEEDAMELDSVAEGDQTEDDDGQQEDEDEDEEEWDEPPRSPLTYPNTVPFLHAPRMGGGAGAGGGGGSWSSSLGSGAGGGPSRRAASFSDHHQRRQPPSPRGATRLERQSFSIPRPGLPPIEYVTSRSPHSHHHRRPSDASSSRLSHYDPRDRGSGSGRDRRPPRQVRVDEPRLLISNNDLTVKMFALRAVPPSTANTTQTQGGQFTQGTLEQTFDDWSRGPEASGAGPVASRIARERLNRQLSEFQRIVGVPIRQSAFGNFPPESPTAGPPPMGTGMQPGQKNREERKLVRIGGSKFKCAINHSSLSPNLRNMVSVGDSDEVYLYEVVDGGREFRKVATYKAATDSGFSTAWSRDGRKFAVASQDGQVTVWDHRSSKALAKFYSSRGGASTQPSSFSSDLYSSLTARNLHPPILVDPVTGDTRVGSSSSGREAARVVKFSPESAPRDLLVFSEENTNIHVIDAQTLNTHVVLPVPPSPSPSPSTPVGGAPRLGHEGGTWGIAGIAFDPTGQYLYSGTERTVVEWDMRGGPRGEGVWDMA